MTKIKTAMPVTAKKSYKEGHVALGISLKCRGWNSDSARIEGGADITSAQARELAVALVQWADKADAKVAAKAESEERRHKWREREIAAGRMKVLKLGSTI
ncbi:hypothetical protein [Fimbriiglobus ruber]|uniref:hypothetical protein n=1 Tax=Fimbriiglobus ruber TaxID=1908690 RepID=UPI000B4AD83D|nr:hypothetical protein [Fimbriiglobus ruber]